MNEITSILLAIGAIYLLASIFLYLYQRKLIYFPVAIDSAFVGEEITVDNQETRLHGWVLNPGKANAVIYFGGNNEMVTHRQEFFEDVFRGYSIYLINYRGYGLSQGRPSEAGLFADALAIYDQIAPAHETVTAYGRSLGSGVAVYLAANRPLQKLILLTPYDSVASIAQRIYPIFPVRLLIKDRFDSASRAGDIDIPVLIAAAERDREVEPRHTQALRQSFNRAAMTYVTIAGAAHNDIVDFPQYRAAVREFVVQQGLKPDDS